MNSFSVILVAVDKSEHSDRAVELARDLAKLSGGVVHLCHVLEHELIKGKGGGTFELETETEVESLLEKEMAVMAESGVTAHPHISRSRQEHTFQTILQVADEVSADVIVMGTRGLSAFAAIMLGSTTYKLLHTSRRPVLVVS